MLDLIDLSNWKKKKDILTELAKDTGITIDERGWRLMVERHNKLYFEHLTDVYIAHSNKGYKTTKDENEVRLSLYDNKKRAIDQFMKYHKGMKALGENFNFKLEIRDNELIFIENYLD